VIHHPVQDVVLGEAVHKIQGEIFSAVSELATDHIEAFPHAEHPVQNLDIFPEGTINGKLLQLFLLRPVQRRSLPSNAFPDADPHYFQPDSKANASARSARGKRRPMFRRGARFRARISPPGETSQRTGWGETSSRFPTPG